MEYVVINRHRVAHNRKNKCNVPVIRVSNGKYGKPRYVKHWVINGEVEVCYTPDDPLPCGATAYLRAHVLSHPDLVRGR